MPKPFAHRILAPLLVAVAPAAFAQAFTAIDAELRKVESSTSQRGGGAQVAQKMAAGFATLAGSRDNALKLFPRFAA